MKKYLVLATSLIVLCSVAFADYLGSFNIDDTVAISATLHAFATGAPTAATGDVHLQVYEDGSATQIVDANLVAFDSVTGFYVKNLTLADANGFTSGGQYLCLIQATVSAVAGITTHNFQILAPVNAAAVGGETPLDETTVANQVVTFMDANSTQLAAILLDTGTTLQNAVDANGVTIASIIIDTNDTRATLDTLVATGVSATLSDADKDDIVDFIDANSLRIGGRY